MENKLEELTVEENKIKVDIDAFEIVTIMVEWKLYAREE